MNSKTMPIHSKVLALFLSIALVLGLCPGLSKVAYAEEQTTVTAETTVQQEEKTAPDDQTQNSQTVDEQESSVEMPDVVDLAEANAAKASPTEDAQLQGDNANLSSVTGGAEITKGGTYDLASDASGVITVSTTEAVTFVGSGVTVTYDEKGHATLTGTSVNVAFDASSTPGVNITLKDAYLSNKTDLRNTFNFAGAGNKLSFEGTNVLDYDKGFTSNNDALIHVPDSTELTILGSGTAYIYNCTQGAGIGGNTGENNGKIIFGDSAKKTGPTIFEKGTRQGAVIGAGANSSKATTLPGEVVFEAGVYYLISNSRGAVIGGSAGSNGASAGTKVTINEGSININVDYSGAAIGGGGFDSGNDASGGTLVVNGGSLRVYVDKNAVNASYKGWEGQPLVEGICDAAVTAKRVNNNGDAVRRCAVDTSNLATSDTYKVVVDGSEASFFNGQLHSYSFIQEALDKNKGEQLTITDTPTNWVKNQDSSLYLYLTEKDHVIDVNGKKFDAKWDSETKSFDVQSQEKPNVSASATGNGTVKVAVGEQSPTPSVVANPGDVVTVSATPATDSYLAQVRYASKAEDETEYKNYTAVQQVDGTYSFTMPEGSVQVYADFVSKVWDGTMDATWYDPSKTEFHLNYAAQFAAAAALNNGIFTTYPTSTVGTEGSSQTHDVPDYEKYLELVGAQKNEAGEITGSNLYGEFEKTYTIIDTQVSTSSSNSLTRTARLVGDPTRIVAKNSTGSSGSNNQVTTSTYWYGAVDYNGVSLYIDSDLDFGATKTSDGKWDPSSPLFMSLGGQYAMLPQNGWSVLGSSFNGKLDGNGHKFMNVYGERYSGGGNFGDSQSMGIVGRLGNHDGDPADNAAVNPTVRQIVLESGYMCGRRSSGCIVGKIGQTSATKKNDGSTGGIIEYCINKADIFGTDKKGIGGIVGAAWNQGVIRYCANFGKVSNPSFNVGGIVGTCEVPVIGCYNVGYVYSGNKSRSQAIGSNNGGNCSWTDCFYLKGSTNNTSSSPKDGVYGGKINNVKSFGTDGDVDSLQAWMVNGGSDADDAGAKIWFNDTTGINSKDGVNYPVLYFQKGVDTSTEYNIYLLQSSENGQVSVDKTTAKYGESVTLSNEVLKTGYAFDYYVVDGAKTTNNTFVVTKNTMVSGYFRELHKVPFSTEDTTGKPYTISVKKDGIKYVDGVAQQVTGEIVNPGDDVYEGDWLYYTPTIKDGAVPEDPNYVYSGSFTIRTFNNDVSQGYGEKYCVKSSDENLQVKVEGVDEERKSWYELADTSWYNPSQDEFTLTTPEQLAGVAKLVNDYKAATDDTPEQGANFAGKTIKLENDISLKNADGTEGIRQWCPISTNADARLGKIFMGAFDGQGHKVSDIIVRDYITNAVSSSRGLFGQVQDATIKNVTVEGEIKEASSTGGIVGVAERTTVENCVSKVLIVADTRPGNVGGIVGQLASGTVKNCANAGDVVAYTSYNNAGGIVGSAASSIGTTDKCLIEGCTNKGAVKSLYTTRNSGYIGGITGQVGKNVEVSKCVNEGNVTSHSNPTNRYIKVGGIAAEIDEGGIITECANKGDVSCNSKSDGVGGIVGNMSSGGTISDSYNTGNVESTMDDVLVGGMVGNCSGSKPGSLTNCYNAGTAKAITEANAGAISPNYYQKPAVTNSYYLDSTGTSGGLKTDDTFEGATAKSSEDLKDAAALLGDKFAKDPAGGYPILSVQNTVTVKFETYGGSFVADQTVQVGSTAKQPEDPSKDNYKFAGWFADSAFESEFDFSAPVSEDTTVYANWVPAGKEVTRIFGDDCYGTNLDTIRHDIAENGTPRGVIVCGTSHYLDSLSAAALSGLLDYPVLLVNGTDDTINDSSLTALKKITNSGVNKIDIVVLGGKFAVSGEIETQLSDYDNDGKCERIFGDDGYATNRAVYDFGASKGNWSSEAVVVASGAGYHDALGAGSYAAAKKEFILLVNPEGDNSQMVEKAKAHESATILGGQFAVPAQVETDLNNAGVKATRIAGDDAYETNVKFVGNALKVGLTLDNAGFSSGLGYYDALGSSHILGKSNSVMFLVSKDESLNQEAYDMLKNSRVPLYKARVFGGQAVITDETVGKIKENLE